MSFSSPTLEAWTFKGMMQYAEQQARSQLLNGSDNLQHNPLWPVELDQKIGLI